MENEVKSYRKPYVRPVKANWWTDRSFYIAYMLREGTAVWAVLVALELLVLSFPGTNVDAVLSNPLMIIINLISLVAVLFHALTWFNLMPKAVRMFATKKPTDVKLIPAKLIVTGLWAVAVGSFVVIILAVVAKTIHWF